MATATHATTPTPEFTSAYTPALPPSAQPVLAPVTRPSPAPVDASYLAAASAMLRQQKQLTYDAMHLVPGSAQRVLDVGCGPATDTIPLAQLLGPRGQVVGVDADPAMLAEADRHSAAAGVSDRATHLQADAHALPFAAASFDACRSERLLQHVRDPERVLAEMARVTKPGGWLVVLDTDWGTVSIDSLDPAIERKLVRLAAERLARNGYSGRALYRLFRLQGLQDVHITPLTLALTDLGLVRQMGRLDFVEAEALGAGVLSLGELALWLDGLLEAEATGTFFASVTLILASGRKPGPPAVAS